MAKQNKAQKDTVERVMHEFKHGELKMRGGRKVKNPRQAIAIGLREAGASKFESKKDNARSLRRTTRQTGPVRDSLIKRGLLFSPRHGELALTRTLIVEPSGIVITLSRFRAATSMTHTVPSTSDGT